MKQTAEKQGIAMTDLDSYQDSISHFCYAFWARTLSCSQGDTCTYSKSYAATPVWLSICGVDKCESYSVYCGLLI